MRLRGEASAYASPRPLDLGSEHPMIRMKVFHFRNAAEREDLDKRRSRQIVPVFIRHFSMSIHLVFRNFRQTEGWKISVSRRASFSSAQRDLVKKGPNACFLIEFPPRAHNGAYGICAVFGFNAASREFPIVRCGPPFFPYECDAGEGDGSNHCRQWSSNEGWRIRLSTYVTVAQRASYRVVVREQSLSISIARFKYTVNL